jgi:hypothetical protein
MQTGFKALAKTMEESAARASLFGTGSLDYFKLQPGEKKIVRFLTDDVLTAQFAERVMTHTGKRQSFLVDPNNNLVVKYMSPGAWEGKLATRTAAVAVLREEQYRPPTPGVPDPANPGTPSATVEYVDHFETREDGLKARVFLLVLQAHGNFWDQLVGFHSIYHTVCDRDYAITRIGAELDTKYRIVPLDPVDALRDPQVVAQTYGYGRPWNKDDANRYLYCPQTLKEWSDYYGGEERIKHHLVGDAPVQGVAPDFAGPQASSGSWGPVPTAGAQDPVLGGGLGEFHPATTHNPDPASVPSVQPDQSAEFATLKGRLRSQIPGQPQTS